MVHTDINKIQIKIDNLLELRLDGTIEKETYNNKYGLLKIQLDELKQKQYTLENALENTENTKDRVLNFQKIFSENKPLEEFDNLVFRYAIDKIILGGRDENGFDPYLVTFCFNNGVEAKKSYLKTTNQTTIISNGDITKKNLIIAEYIRHARLTRYDKNSDNYMGKRYQTDFKIRISI